MTLIPLSEDEPLSLASPRLLEVLPGESHNWDEVTVIGKGERRAISLDIHLREGSAGRMIRTFDVPEGARLNIFHRVRIDEGARWQNVVCVRGQGSITIRRVVEVFGQGGEARLACLGVMDKSGRISVSDEIFSHAPQTKNDMRTKIVLNEAAHSEVRGRIVVDRHSAHSTSFERLDHLLLGHQTSAVAIPELLVETDDVKCGHGATTSRPREPELFYLASRGLSLSGAERLLAQGFIASALVDLPEQARTESLEVLFS